jgi:hypothetical protein
VAEREPVSPRVRLDRIPASILVAGTLLVIAALLYGVERLLPEPAPARPERAPWAGFAVRPVLREEEDGTIVLELGREASRIRLDREEQRPAMLECLRSGIDREFPDAPRTQGSWAERHDAAKRLERVRDGCLRKLLEPPVGAPRPAS